MNWFDMSNQSQESKGAGATLLGTRVAGRVIFLADAARCLRTARCELLCADGPSKSFIPDTVVDEMFLQFGSRAIALLNLGYGVPRSRSFDVAVRRGISLHILARPRRSSVTVVPHLKKAIALAQLASSAGPPSGSFENCWWAGAAKRRWSHHSTSCPASNRHWPWHFGGLCFRLSAIVVRWRNRSPETHHYHDLTLEHPCC